MYLHQLSIHVSIISSLCYVISYPHAGLYLHPYVLSLSICKQTHFIPPETRAALRAHLGRKPPFASETRGPREAKLQKRKPQSLQSCHASGIRPGQRGLGKDAAPVLGRVLEHQSTPKEHRPGGAGFALVPIHSAKRPELPRSSMPTHGGGGGSHQGHHQEGFTVLGCLRAGLEPK